MRTLQQLIQIWGADIIDALAFTLFMISLFAALVVIAASMGEIG